MADFDVPGALRRIRRRADLSQRELATACGVATSVVAHAEARRRGLTVDLLARAAAVAGLRLALVDDAGAQVDVMSDRAVRDRNGRRFPAHLDVRYSEDGWWHDAHRYSRPRPWYTFDRDRSSRDGRRRVTGPPADHQEPRPGDDPTQRAAERRRAALRREAEERQRRFLAGEFRGLPDAFTCTCSTGCDYAEGINEDLQHASGCACRCDLG